MVLEAKLMDVNSVSLHSYPIIMYLLILTGAWS